MSMWLIATQLVKEKASEKEIQNSSEWLFLDAMEIVQLGYFRIGTVTIHFNFEITNPGFFLSLFI